VAYDHAAAAALLRDEHPRAAWAQTVVARIEQARTDAG